MDTPLPAPAAEAADSQLATDGPMGLAAVPCSPALEAALMWADAGTEDEANCFPHTATERYKAAYQALTPWMRKGQNASAAALNILATAIRQGNGKDQAQNGRA